ncbi:hypothetical protein LSH36_839g02004 [Paralvinella palmiformis]|uniref:Fibrinogen C-terminal domain-containing protein n=1 Tax=Paralvinella palmiformis TaxID=53620 RepID=A0AAD9J020_9ANNE|nr:hypothetical protein LSH36_839g02004 [Paralvinella palmiformis]
MFNISIDAPVPIRTKFRIQLPSYVEGRVNVSLIGTNIRCDTSFFVTPLSEAETERWTDVNSCSDVSVSGIYNVTISVTEKKEVYCEAEVDGGGWTVIMRRMDGSVDFLREWEDYKLGFGSLDAEFWAANALKLHNGCQFSTETVDHDTYEYGNLASFYGSPWWHCDTVDACLTGYYGGYDSNKLTKGIGWLRTWPYDMHAKYVCLMIRPN